MMETFTDLHCVKSNAEPKWWSERRNLRNSFPELNILYDILRELPIF